MNRIGRIVFLFVAIGFVAPSVAGATGGCKKRGFVDHTAYNNHPHDQQRASGKMSERFEQTLVDQYWRVRNADGTLKSSPTNAAASTVKKSPTTVETSVQSSWGKTMRNGGYEAFEIHN